MKISFNGNCKRCGACNAINPEMFELTENGVATAFTPNVPKVFQDDVIDCALACPVCNILIDEYGY